MFSQGLFSGELSKEKPPTQRVPRYPVVMMEAFEHVVEDESQRIGFRLVAWVKLVKLWATLRWNDVHKIIPKKLKFLWRTHNDYFENNEDLRAIETSTRASSLRLRACFCFEPFLAED